MTDPIRLSKRLAELHCLLAPREAELYIEGGWASVDGEVIEEPQFKVLDQRVELLPGARAETIEPATLLLANRPAGATTISKVCSPRGGAGAMTPVPCER